MKTRNLLLLIVGFISIKGHPQSISENTSYPTSTQVQCEYKFNGGTGINFEYWMPPSNCIAVNNNISGVYLYLKWKNIEASAGKSTLRARWHDSQLYTHDVNASVGPFQLSFPNPTFVGGATKNIPCHSSAPVTISINPYINTADNGIDKDLEITSHFTWTLPSGWQTTGGKTGTFDAYSSITVIPQLSPSTVAIRVQPYADAGQVTQYGPNVSLQITRNLEPFTITGPINVVYNSTYRYEVPSYPGVSYSWQLPAGWSGNSTANYIDVTAGCGSGNIVATMTGCNGTKTSQKSIISNIIEQGTIISGPSLVCSSGATFSINNAPAPTTITWNSSSNLTLSNALSNYCTYSANSNGEGWIEATINAPACGTSITLPRKSVWAGVPPSPNTIFEFCCDGKEFGSNSVYNFTTPDYTGFSTFEWVVGGGTIISGQGTNSIAVLTPEVTGLQNIYFDVAVRAGSCNLWSNYFFRHGYVTSGIGPVEIIISPNPSNSETTVELNARNNKPFDENIEWNLEVYNSTQSLKEKKTKIKGTQTKLITNGWKEGVYIVRAKIGEDIVSEKLIIKH